MNDLDFTKAIEKSIKDFQDEVAKPHFGTRDVTDPDRTCLSWWFPRLVHAGLPVPETRFVAVNYARSLVEGHLDKVLNEAVDGLSKLLIGLASDEKIGWPCFLRTGHFSGKHNWNKTCFVDSPESMLSNMSRLAEMQELCGIMTKNPFSVWVVRKMLPTKPIVRCLSYGMFPVTREMRVFVDDERVAYTVPYWPENAIADGAPEHDKWKLEDVQGFTDEELKTIRLMASHAGGVCGGRWSVDILDTEDGWYITDMAEAELSYGYDPERFNQ